jgi:hypothetical protein
MFVVFHYCYLCNCLISYKNFDSMIFKPEEFDEFDAASIMFLLLDKNFSIIFHLYLLNLSTFDEQWKSSRTATVGHTAIFT